MGYRYDINKKENERILENLSNREWSRDEILKNLQWTYFFERDGSLSSVSHCSETKNLHEEELEAIAPFVEDGSFIEVSGDDDDDIFRFVFRKGELRKSFATISFSEE